MCCPRAAKLKRRDGGGQKAGASRIEYAISGHPCLDGEFQMLEDRTRIANGNAVVRKKKRGPEGGGGCKLVWRVRGTVHVERSRTAYVPPPFFAGAAALELLLNTAANVQAPQRARRERSLEVAFLNQFDRNEAPLQLLACELQSRRNFVDVKDAVIVRVP